MAKYIEVTVLSDQIARIKRSVELNTEFMNSENSTYYLSALQNVKKTIASIPTADVAEVRHGKWLTRYIHNRLSSGAKVRWEVKSCSICMHTQICESNYCPNCGAKMNKEG